MQTLLYNPTTNFGITESDKGDSVVPIGKKEINETSDNAMGRNLRTSHLTQWNIDDDDDN